METVTEFKYLGRILTDTDDDTPTVINNLNKIGYDWVKFIAKLSYEKKRTLNQWFQFVK